MKKSIVLISTSLLLLCSAHSVVKAQENTDKKSELTARFGIKAGFNLSNLYTESGEADDKKMLGGFNAGVFAKLPIAKFLAIQPELYFTTKGAQINYKNAFVDGDARFRLNYIELPVLLVVNINQNFNIHGGPYAGYLVNSSVSNKSNASAFDFEKNLNNDDYNRFDAGLAVGAGLDIGAVGIGARYSYGFTKVGKERTFPGGQSYTFPNAQNGVLNVYLSLSLN